MEPVRKGPCKQKGSAEGEGKDVQKLGVKAKSEDLDPGAQGERAAGQRSPGLMSHVDLPWGPLISNGKDYQGEMGTMRCFLEMRPAVWEESCWREIVRACSGAWVEGPVSHWQWHENVRSEITAETMCLFIQQTSIY